MRGNTFGSVFSVTTFGESHGVALGTVIDGCPAGVIWRQELLERFMNRRRPGASVLTSARQELDQVQILSGVYEGRTLGTPIAAVIYNNDARSKDYAGDKLKMRQGHATDLWQEKFGHSDPRGSGRASGRETVSRVAAGSVARMLVEQLHPAIKLYVLTQNIGAVHFASNKLKLAIASLKGEPWAVDQYSCRCPDEETNKSMQQLLTEAKASGESYGASVVVYIEGLPRGLGEPVFRKLKNQLGSAYLSIGATMGLEFGEGFAVTTQAGHDFHKQDQGYAGLRGGLSTGDPLLARVAFKPPASRGDFAKQGRHDPCIVPRAIPVVEAMTWMVLADLVLLTRLDKI